MTTRLNSRTKALFQNPNGFQTNVWGPGAWLFLHCITLNYNPKYSRQYYNFFKSIQHILPCKTCRENYTHSIKNQASLKLSKDVFKSRESLAFWLFKLHNYVRCRTGAPTVFTNNRKGFISMVHFYEQFRAKCMTKQKVTATKHVGCVTSYYKGLRLRAKIVIKPFCSRKPKFSITVQTPTKPPIEL